MSLSTTITEFSNIHDRPRSEFIPSQDSEAIIRPIIKQTKKIYIQKIH